MDHDRRRVLELIRQHARPLKAPLDVAPVLSLIGDARVVLVGEATHGSDEFYRYRAALTQRLVAEHGFDAVAIEADWPSAARAGRHAMAAGSDPDVRTSLAGFERFPRWMWRNTATLDFLQWLRTHNAARDRAERVGLHGLDLYSLRESMHAVLGYLDATDPAAAGRARARYGCFDDFADNPQAYGHAVKFGLDRGCEDQAVHQLAELLQAVPDGDDHFYAQQNARVVRNAETYYRSMFAGRTESWNVRDRHMAETLTELRRHLAQQRGRPARIVVWAHNSHVGDARATERSEPGQLTLGQLARQQHPGETFLLGLTTHEGSVAAAQDWDEPVQWRRVRPSRPDSVERLLHDSGIARFVLPLREPSLQQHLPRDLLERAIGVIYRPETERWSHYFEAALAEQFDAVVHFDRTQALQPLDAPRWEHEAEAETWPSAL